VELTCHRCGAPVEEGVAFCHCGAPQIRVSVEPGVPLPPPVESPVLELPLSTEEASGPRLLPIAIFAGLLEALFTFFGIGIFTGGLVSVALYRRRNLGKDLNSGLEGGVSRGSGTTDDAVPSISAGMGALCGASNHLYFVGIPFDFHFRWGDRGGGVEEKGLLALTP